jgi:hypothetical protein
MGVLAITMFGGVTGSRSARESSCPRTTDLRLPRRGAADGLAQLGSAVFGDRSLGFYA